MEVGGQLRQHFTLERLELHAAQLAGICGVAARFPEHFLVALDAGAKALVQNSLETQQVHPVDQAKFVEPARQAGEVRFRHIGRVDSEVDIGLVAVIAARPRTVDPDACDVRRAVEQRHELGNARRGDAESSGWLGFVHPRALSASRAAHRTREPPGRERMPRPQWPSSRRRCGWFRRGSP